MPILTQPAFGPRTALIYVTVGALIDVWTLVWYFTRDYELSRSGYFWVIGFLLTGLTLIILGLLLGRIGRAARQAELPPEPALRAEAKIQETAAANPPPTVVSPAQGAAPAVAPAVAPANAPAPAAPPAPPGSVQTQRMI
jgi:hypothetical protein